MEIVGGEQKLGLLLMAVVRVFEGKEGIQDREFYDFELCTHVTIGPDT